MSATITRRECGRCGAEVAPDRRKHFCGSTYPLKATDDIRERTYVAVDALLSDDALEAGVGVPYEEYAVEDLRAVIRAAVEAVKA